MISLFFRSVIRPYLAAAILFSILFAAPPTSNFSPKPDGFIFHNYGGGFPSGDLTIDDVRGLFGDAVCTSIEGDKCIPTPDAQLWIDSMNGYMLDGHCVGFTVLSYRLFQNQLEQSAFNPKSNTTFELDQSNRLMRKIAQNYIFQVFDEVYRATVDGTPKDVLEKLIRLNAPADIGIFSRTNMGHSVYAYGVEDKGNGIYWIKVYDSNAPAENVHIEVNTKANTWKYYPAEFAPSSNPDDWQGDKKSNSLIFTPLSAYDLPPICPFCQSTSHSSLPPKGSLAKSTLLAGNSSSYVTMSGGVASLQLTNLLGQRVGQFEESVINEIPGAYFLRLRGGLASPGIMLSLPNLEDYSLQINGIAGMDGNNIDIRTFGGEVFVSVDGINSSQNSPETISISGTPPTLKFTASNEQRPTLKLAFSVGGVIYLLVVGNADMQSGNSLSVSIDPSTGELNLGSNEMQDGTLSLAFARINGDDIQIFANNYLQLGPNDSATIELGEWDGQNSLPLQIDLNNDGTPDSEIDLSDQNLGSLLESDQTANQIISEFNEFAPYMNSEENTAFVESLIHLGLSARDMGNIFYEFDLFGMSAEELAEFILTQFTNPFDRANFLYELHFSPELQTEVINLLPESWRMYLEGQISMFGNFDETYFQGVFEGYSGEELTQFIHDSLLSPQFPLPLPLPIPPSLLPPTFSIPPWVMPSEPPSLPVQGSNPF